MPLSKRELNAQLFARGLQRPDYQPSLYDVTAVLFKVFDEPPVIVRNIQLKAR